MAEPPASEPRDTPGTPRSCGCEAYCDDCLNRPLVDCDLVTFSRSLFARFGEGWHDWGQWESTEFSSVTVECPSRHSSQPQATPSERLLG